MSGRVLPVMPTRCGACPGGAKECRTHDTKIVRYGRGLLVRVTVRVRPGATRPGVGGEHDGALVVRVSARAVDGKATEAALAAVAEAFGVRRRAVSLVSGTTSRTKVVDVAGAETELRPVLEQLLAR